MYYIPAPPDRDLHTRGTPTVLPGKTSDGVGCTFEQLARRFGEEAVDRAARERLAQANQRVRGCRLRLFRGRRTPSLEALLGGLDRAPRRRALLKRFRLYEDMASGGTVLVAEFDSLDQEDLWALNETASEAGLEIRVHGASPRAPAEGVVVELHAK